jgi:hypothetical protein
VLTIVFFCCTQGNWTAALYKLLIPDVVDSPDLSRFEEGQEELREVGGEVEGREGNSLNFPVERKAGLGLRLRGPFGAPAEHLPLFPLAVCVSAGIGVTPFLSGTGKNSPSRFQFF